LATVGTCIGIPYLPCVKLVLQTEFNLGSALACAAEAIEQVIEKKLACPIEVLEFFVEAILSDDPFMECIKKCADDPTSYGQECVPGQEKLICKSGKVIERWTCAKSGMDICPQYGSTNVVCSEDDECVWRLTQVILCDECTKCKQISRRAAMCVKDDNAPDCSDPSDPSPKAPSTQPGNDHPDDNYDVSTCPLGNCTLQTAENINWLLKPPKIAILDRGFPSGITSFLDNMNESYITVSISTLEYLDPLDYPSLIIPSGDFLV